MKTLRGFIQQSKQASQIIGISKKQREEQKAMLKFASKLNDTVLTFCRERSPASEQGEQLHEKYTREVLICKESHRHQRLAANQARQHPR